MCFSGAAKEWKRCFRGFKKRRSVPKGISDGVIADTARTCEKLTKMMCHAMKVCLS